MELCHDVWSMTHGEKIAEPCGDQGTCNITHSHQQIMETPIGPGSGVLPGQGLVTPYNLLPMCLAAIISGYNPLSTSNLMIIIEHMFLPVSHPGLVFHCNILRFLSGLRSLFTLSPLEEQ